MLEIRDVVLLSDLGVRMSDEQMKSELNKFSLSQAEHDADLRQQWEQESHWRFKESHWKFQRWFWVGTVVLLALGIIFK